jgi:hypothetical protein
MAKFFEGILTNLKFLQIFLLGLSRKTRKKNIIGKWNIVLDELDASSMATCE